MWRKFGKVVVWEEKVLKKFNGSYNASVRIETENEGFENYRNDISNSINEVSRKCGPYFL